MLTVNNVFFSYHQSLIIEDVSFSIEKGQNLAIMGESGCGKSTLLKLIYGLHDLNEGQIFWNTKEILGPKYNLIPGMDFMKYLAQDFDLMPFITVSENIGKFLSNVNPKKKKDRILEVLEIVEMTEYANTKAKFLSGGQMQRVAIARVLALEPEVLLLDEPFSHIDTFRKNSLRRKLYAYLKQKGITCITASHDSMEVLSFADNVVVMAEGKIIESGHPKAIFDNPKSTYIASLFGDVNKIEKHYFEESSLENDFLFVYPHQLRVVENSKLKVKVIKSYFMGSHYLIEAEYEKGILFFESKDDFSKSSVLWLKK